MLLEDRVALITGAGSGIGQGVALRFAKEGVKLALADIRPESLEDTASKLTEAGAEFASYSGDVSVTDDVERIFAETGQRFGRLDICVDNAGIGNPPMPLWHIDDEEVDRT